MWSRFDRTPPLLSMEDDEGMVQSGGEPSTAAYLNHTKEDHGGACGALPAPYPPGGEYPHVCEAYPHRRLYTYGEGGKLGVAYTTGTQVRRPLPDACLISPEVAEGVSSIRSGDRRRGDARARGEVERGIKG